MMVGAPSAHTDREIVWKHVHQSTTVFIAFLKGVILPGAPGTQLRRK